MVYIQKQQIGLDRADSPTLLLVESCTLIIYIRLLLINDPLAERSSLQ